MSTNEASFSINVTAASGENYAGPFTIRKRLSHVQTLRRDELRRQLLGSNSDNVPVDLQKNAIVLSTCASYVKNAPKWWTENSNGLDLLDEEPVSKVFEEISKVVDAVEAELKAKEAKATEVLKVE